MQVLSVQMQANLPFVLLRDIRTPERALPVFIGPVEASSIALGLARIESALREGAPVYATNAGLDEARVVVTTRDELLEEAVETFRHELDTLYPADFVGPPDAPQHPDAPEGSP